ncbi:ATP-binding cassette, regulator of translational elongation [Diplodia seriata]
MNAFLIATAALNSFCDLCIFLSARPSSLYLTSFAGRGQVSSTLGLSSGAVDLESANARRVESKVDRKKLEKAERKIRAKQDKKEMRYATSSLIVLVLTVCSPS